MLLVNSGFFRPSSHQVGPLCQEYAPGRSAEKLGLLVE